MGDLRSRDTLTGVEEVDEVAEAIDTSSGRSSTIGRKEFGGSIATDELSEFGADEDDNELWNGSFSEPVETMSAALEVDESVILESEEVRACEKNEVVVGSVRWMSASRDAEISMESSQRLGNISAQAGFRRV